MYLLTLLFPSLMVVIGPGRLYWALIAWLLEQPASLELSRAGDIAGRVAGGAIAVAVVVVPIVQSNG